LEDKIMEKIKTFVVGFLVLVATLPAQVGSVFNAAYQAAQSNYTGDAKTDSLSDMPG
jgi:hypothetical protein